MNTSPDRRHFTRIPFDARYVLSDATGETRREGEVLDISLKGALLHNTRTDGLAPGEPYRLRLTLDENVSLSMEVSVAHVETDRLGVHCESMDVDSATHLRRLLELNLGDEDLLERELAEMMDSH